MSDVKRYYIEQSRDWPAEFVDWETDKPVRDITDEVVVLASDFDALLEDAKRLYKALGHSVGMTRNRDAEIDAARGHFYERWLEEDI